MGDMVGGGRIGVGGRLTTVHTSWAGGGEDCLTDENNDDARTHSIPKQSSFQNCECTVRLMLHVTIRIFNID